MKTWQYNFCVGVEGWEDAVESSSHHKKQLLLEMARNGESRPSVRRHPLGSVLVEYTQPGGCYDKVFDKQVRKLAPHWFIDTAVEKKKQLLQMARRGKPKPRFKKDLLGVALQTYTQPSCASYDPDFTDQIKKLAPDWFNTSKNKKQKLLQMAKDGHERPNYKHPLSQVLRHYTATYSKCYDPVFDKQIRKLAPHWFNRKAS